MINLNLQIERFLNYCKSRKALNEKTIKAYRIDLRQFSEYTGNIFSKEMICQYIDMLHEQFKPKTIKRKMASPNNLCKSKNIQSNKGLRNKRID